MPADNAKTIVITGASSGIGKAAARLFHEKGWNVVATMRRPEAETDLRPSERMKLAALDVQDAESPRKAVAEAIAAFGRIDVWLNNAGYGAFGPVEAGTREQIARQFDVNVFGLIACVQAVAPHFRERRSGTLINVSSVGGIIDAAGLQRLHATKFAVEGLWKDCGTARQLRRERRLVEPGAIKTEFGGRSADVWDISRVPDYAGFMQKVKATRETYTRNSSSPELVAEVIYAAAIDPSDRLRYLAGPDARRFVPLRRLLGAPTMMRMVRKRFGL